MKSGRAMALVTVERGKRMKFTIEGENGNKYEGRLESLDVETAYNEGMTYLLNGVSDVVVTRKPTDSEVREARRDLINAVLDLTITLNGPEDDAHYADSVDYSGDWVKSAARKYVKLLDKVETDV